MMNESYPRPSSEKTPASVLEMFAKRRIESQDLRDDAVMRADEGIAAILSFPKILNLQRVRDAQSKNKDAPHMPIEQSRDMFRSFTEFNFLLTHLLITSADDMPYLETFWRAMKRIAEDADMVRELETIRSGIVTQAAVYHVFTALGKTPSLSHPDEDAFHAIDMWNSSDEVIQISSGREPGVYDSEHIAPPGVQVVDSSGAIASYSADQHMTAKTTQFIMKAEKYGKHINKKLKAYTLVIPRSEVDRLSGKPSAKLVEFFRERLNAVS